MSAAKRRSLVPRTTIVATILIVAVMALATAAVIGVARSRLVPVPDLGGLPRDIAVGLAEQAGLRYAESGTRVSAEVPAGLVIDQTPAPGARVRPGDAVSVVVSAGPQTGRVPDLVGVEVGRATETLEALGFAVTIETASVETTSSVVLEMFPAPGADVAPGSRIRLTVPGGTAASAALLPFPLGGTTVILDPVAPSSGLPDVTMEVARRLRSLLEASGARVVMVRSAAQPVTVAERESSVATTEAAVYIGLVVTGEAGEGVRAYHAPAGTAWAERSYAYARAVTSAARLPGALVNEPLPSDERVMGAFRGPAVAVALGSASAPADRTRFADPAWADAVARAIYRGVGVTVTGNAGSGTL